MASLPFVKGICVMPDVHWGIGATVGSVIATKDVVIPAAVGVDIGCGMLAVRTNIEASWLPDSLLKLRRDIEGAVPVGFNQHEERPKYVKDDSYLRGLSTIMSSHPKIKEMVKGSPWDKCRFQTGTLGGGNHFIEVCLDEDDMVWVMLHSGSRGIGNIIGRYFIAKAKEDMLRLDITLPDVDLAYLTANTKLFNDYVYAVSWAQSYAFSNRAVMVSLVLEEMLRNFPDMLVSGAAIDCHHNYVNQEKHFGQNVWLTRKGAVRAFPNTYGIIPGSMGVKSYIVQGTEQAATSFYSCSHGAGRRMSRTQAKKEISIDDHIAATEGVECRKDKGVLDESPGAYKDIDAVMEAQSDLVEIKHTLKAVVCVKG
jgi:tRNA-splicing ligase RtcB